MSDWKPREKERSYTSQGWMHHDESQTDAVINCHGGGAEVNNCRVNIFNIKIEIGKDFNPEALKQLIEILEVSKQQLPHKETDHERQKEIEIKREEKRRLFGR